MRMSSRAQGKENHGNECQPQPVKKRKILSLSKRRELNSKERFSVSVMDE